MKTLGILSNSHSQQVKTMTTGQKQRLFTRLIAELVIWAYEQGYELTYGDAYRDPRVHGKHGEKKSYSAAGSVHKMRLAVDFNLFIDGKWMTDTSDHLPIGEKWESMHELCRWGGRFDDGNHYSLEWNGYK